MLLRLFKPVRVDRPSHSRRRDGSGNGVALVSERHQTALRGRVADPLGPATAAPWRDAPETSPCRLDGHATTTARSPQGNGRRLAKRRGNRDPRPSWFQPTTASAQLVAHSSVGPPRSIASAGWATRGRLSPPG